MLDSKAGVIRSRVYTVDAGDWCLYDLQRRRAAAVLDTGRSEGTGHQRLGLFSRGTMSPLPWCSTAPCSQLGSPETQKTGGGSIRGTVGGSSRPPKSCAPDRLSLFKTPGRVRYRWVQAWRRQGAHPGFQGPCSAVREGEAAMRLDAHCRPAWSRVHDAERLRGAPGHMPRPAAAPGWTLAIPAARAPLFPV